MKITNHTKEKEHVTPAVFEYQFLRWIFHGQWCTLVEFHHSTYIDSMTSMPCSFLQELYSPFPNREDGAVIVHFSFALAAVVD